jgi:hypothetical protein
VASAALGRTSQGGIAGHGFAIPQMTRHGRIRANSGPLVIRLKQDEAKTGQGFTVFHRERAVSRSAGISMSANAPPSMTGTCF